MTTMLPDNLAPVDSLTDRPTSGDDLARAYGRPHSTPIWEMF